MFQRSEPKQASRFMGMPKADSSCNTSPARSLQSAGRWILNCSDSDAALRALLPHPSVREVEVASPSLEDAFLELVA